MTPGRFREKTILALCLAFCFVPAAWASLTADELQNIVAKSQAFDAQTRVTTALSGSELTISTYRPERATERDCKIDATLAARAVFEADNSLSRVTVLFYDVSNPGDYYEVPVTLGDVAAFKGGQITQAQLLSGLKLTRHGTPATPVATAEKDQQTSSTPTKEGASAPASAVSNSSEKQEYAEKKIAVATPGSAPAGKAANRTYSNYGVTISYPNTWTLEYPRQGNTLMRLYMSDSALVEMRVYARNEVSPQDVIDADPEDMFRTAWKSAFRKSVFGSLSPELAQLMNAHEQHEDAEGDEHIRRYREQYRAKTGKEYHTSIYRPVSLPSAANIGVGKSVKCLQRGYYATPVSHMQSLSQSTLSSFGEYVQEAVFESRPYTIQIDMLCPYKEAYNYTAGFNALLAELRVAGAGSKPVAASKGH